MKLRLVISESARADLANIAAYGIPEWGRKPAQQYIAAIRKSLEMLRQYPDAGRHREDISGNYRSKPVGRHVLFYRVEVGDLIVIRVLHQQMDVKSRL